MSIQNFDTNKAIRIGEDWESFLNEHPEIKVKKHNGKILDIIFPQEAEIPTLLILGGKVAHLEYLFNGEFVKYTSPNAHESKIYELVEEYNRNIGK